MDNNYNGQFGQNQQMQNPYMNNQYGQNSYVPNQQMTNQYGQGVNPNMYGAGTIPPQQPYGNGMYGYNNPIPPLDPAVREKQMSNANRNKKLLIGLIIGGVITTIAGICFGIFLLIAIVFDTYDIDDYDDVCETCEEVLDVKMEKTELSEFVSDWGYSGYDIVDYATGGEYEGTVRSEVYWIEFDTESEADSFYLNFSEELEDGHNKIKDDYTSNSCSSYVNITEVKLTKNGQRNIRAIVQDEEYVLIIAMDGDKDDVEDVYDEFIDEID